MQKKSCDFVKRKLYRRTEIWNEGFDGRLHLEVPETVNGSRIVDNDLSDMNGSG